MSDVIVRVYDMLGRVMATLVNGRKPAGEYSVEWDGANVPSGVYFCKLTSGDFALTRKMILIR